MQIFWHGLTCIRLEASQGSSEVSLVTDPYDSDVGLRFPRTLAPDVVVLSHQEKKHFPLDQFTKEPFLIADPGEYEVNGIFVFGMPLLGTDQKWPHHMIYRFEVEGMSVGFLGGLNRPLNDEESGKLENIDILLLPVGGGDKINAKQAIETISVIEPRVVVPLYHHLEGLKRELGTADAFCKELGVCRRQDANRLKISKKDLPTEDVLVTVLERA